MPRKCNDDDLVTYSELKPTKGPAPEPPPIPQFDPVVYPCKQNLPSLPPSVDSSDPEAIFNAFFDTEVIESLTLHTNQNAERKRIKNNYEQRSWRPITSNELRTYLGITIWMGCQRLNTIKEYWNTQKEHGAKFELIRESMALGRWVQIHRFFYVGVPMEAKQRPFEKVALLDDVIRKRSQEFMQPGTNLAVDEYIQSYQGRASELVTIPSKPTPTGFKLWCLAAAGYNFDWMWHARGSKARDGPQGVDKKWVKMGFSATQAVVLTLLQRMHDQGRDHTVWLDNLFTSARLLEVLRELGIGGAGTVRTTKTKREEKEEKAMVVDPGDVIDLGDTVDPSENHDLVSLYS
jgi:hypothetical protein